MIYHISLGMYRIFFQIFVLTIVLQLGFIGNAKAQGASESVSKEPVADNPYFNNTGLPLPRYISFASGKVFMRSGPGLRYPIRWIYTEKGLPIEVIQEFDTWRKVRDYEGAEGWVHQSLLSGRRAGITRGDDPVTLYRKSSVDSKPVVELEPMVVLPLEECTKNWCKSEIQGFKGWIEKKFLWGVYADEEFD